MTGTERFQYQAGNIVEILALFLTGQIKWENLSENNQAVLGYCLGLMAENPRFARQVHARQNQISLASGQKTPLFSEEVIKRMKKHRRRKKREVELTTQPLLWQEEPPPNNQIYEPTFVVDPEKRLYELGSNLEKPYYSHIKDTPITAEIRQKREELREMIGLPIARSKDPHVNDPGYQFLVKRVYKFDGFGIFNEYDRVLDEIPQELELKIQEVRGFITELLNPSNTLWQISKRFNQFAQDYQERWNITK